MARILLIEDNEANTKLASLLLRKAGHAVLTASDAETGLTLARTDHPDLVLMDVQLPGMDGLAATALLKKDPVTATIPVIALTALAMKDDRFVQRAASPAECGGRAEVRRAARGAARTDRLSSPKIRSTPDFRRLAPGTVLAVPRVRSQRLLRALEALLDD